MKRNHKNIFIAALSGMVFLACGMGFSAVNTRADSTVQTVKLYEQNFSGLNEGSTADEIYQASGLAGANRSIVAPKEMYIESVYTFFDNGCQHATMYLDSGRGVSSTATDKTYTFNMRVAPYGLVKDTTIALTSENTAAYNSVVYIKPDGTSVCDNYGTEKYVALTSAVMGTDGWWDLVFTAKGTGSFIFVNFYENTTDYATANAQNNTGIRLQTLKVTEGENTVYEMKLAAGLSGDAVFQATGIAGGNSRNVVGGESITGNTLKAIYDFWPTANGGWQKEPLYINEGFSIDTVATSQYAIEFDLKFLGKVNQAIFIINAPVKGGVDSQLAIRADGTSDIYEYGTTKIITDKSVTCASGLYHVKLSVKGFNDKLKFMINMCSSDADGANAAKDTGLLIDNITMSRVDPIELEGEYKTVFSASFNKVEAGAANDAVFQATGFAGADRVIVADGINGTNCLKTTYKFFEDGGWQNGNLYLDVNRTASSIENTVYKLSAKLKPFGSIDKIVMGFEYKGGTNEFVYLNADGTTTLEYASSKSRLIKADLTITDGVYSFDIYLFGNGGYIFNYINLRSSAPADANANKDTGYYLDDYSLNEKKAPEKVGLNVEKMLYNTVNDGDLAVAANIKDVASATIDGEALTDYTFADGKITVSANVMEELDERVHTIVFTDSDSNKYTLEVNVRNAECGTVYENDFSAMPDLNGDQAAKDAFYQNSFMDPASQNLTTEGSGADRRIKFTSTEDVSDAYIGMFQTNPQPGRLNALTKGKVNSVTLTLTPENASLIRARGLVFDNNISTEIFTMDINVLTGKRVDGVVGNTETAYSVKANSDGSYDVTFTFTFDGEYTEKACVYVVFATCKEQENSAWYLDGISANSELIPQVTKANGYYDVASSSTPYYIVDLYKLYTITSIKIGETLLTAADYETAVTPVGGTRIDIAKSACQSYEIGTKATIYITTSKGNVLEVPFEVIDTKPVLPTEKIAYDKALKGECEIAVDLKGYTVSSVSVGEQTLNGTEYYLNNEGVKLLFKYDYLKNLVVGDVALKITTTSGASGIITITISDSTPVFGTAPVYEKTNGGAYVIDLNVFGKEITSVKFADTALEAAKYTFADGKLTISADVLANLAAGDYTLEVQTASAKNTVTVSVKDLDPEFSGTYTVKKGENLVITVELHSKAIVSVTVDGLELEATEYSYANGKLTVNSAIFDEIAVGDRKLVLVTEGGSAELTFKLAAKDAESSSGASASESDCNTSIGADGLLALALVSLIAIAIKRRKNA